MNKTISLLYDLWATQPNGTGKRHGGGKYGEIIMLSLIEKGYKFSCFYDSRLWLNPDIKKQCEKSQIKLYDLSLHKLTDIIAETQTKLIYSALPNRICDITTCKIIGTIHGLRAIETPYDHFLHYHYWGHRLFSLNKNILIADKSRERYHSYIKQQISSPNFKYVTVSNHSKYSLLSQFPFLKSNDIKVFYSPCTFCPGEKKKLDYPYFLMVSGNRWDKNNLRGIIALDRLFSAGFYPSHKVIITGMQENNDNWLHRIKKIFNGKKDIGRYKIKNHNKFIFKGYVGDKELSDLYTNAFAFIYPSLNEGFGYPPLEAMGNGVPVIASAISSIPEILSDASLYFAPFSIEEIMNRLVMLLDESIYKEMSRKALIRFDEVKKQQDKDLEELVDYIINESNDYE